MNVGVGVAVGALMLTGLPILVIASAAAPPSERICVPTYNANGDPTAVSASASASGLDAAQLKHAATIIAVGRSRGIPDHGLVVALATALQESRLQVYANDGLGGDLASDQAGVARSLGLPHEAVGTDHGSLGIFQQQWPWWGSITDLMDPAASAGLFYAALSRVPNWQSMPVTVAAQTVQVSAYPTAYADDEPLARQLVTELGGGIAGTGDDCTAVPANNAVHFPLLSGAQYVDQRNFGASGSSWASTHTGTDLSVACGTPVLAATSGSIRILTDQGWAGPWLVQVSTGLGRLTTWYAHMQTVTIRDGQGVTAGQQIGQVGALGNSTGCHLHFEVHPRGGSIYEDPIDPSAWLTEHARS